MPAPSQTRRYRDMLASVRAARGERCEAYGVPARHAHHVIPIARTGLNDELAFEPANLIILCDDCHALMHPGIRRTDWLTIRAVRGKAIRRSG